jgi:hypothetical protein
MMGALGMGIEIPARNKYGRKPPKDKRRGPDATWKRHKELLDYFRTRDDYSDYLKANKAEYGSVIGQLFLRGEFNQSHCAAARIYAEIVGRNDRFHRIKDPKLQGSPRSPSYERGFGGSDDEVERRTQDGTIVAYERRARRAQRAYDKLQRLVVNDTARTVLDAICVYDQYPASHQIHDLCAQLDIIWEEFKHRYRKHEEGQIKTWRGASERDHPFLDNGPGGEPPGPEAQPSVGE